MITAMLQSRRLVPRKISLIRCGKTLSTSSHIPSIFVANSNTPPEEIIQECAKIRESMQALNDKYKGPLEKTSQKNTVLPFVFLLGNHSSGKSSFVNYICDRKIQAAGVAPTDDMFTIVVPGPSDVDRDGPSLIGDPDMGFAGLRAFGPSLIHHTKLKVRANIKMTNFMLIDSPGMIDSPMVRDAYGSSLRHAAMDRGYDFEGVCRWIAERADVILLFQDPDKPGTTGETLTILTNSLAGMDHKLHIILNKADQFRRIHDFARAYGSLCWNLSKVIQRKDLPRIHTMCLPKAFRADGGSISESSSSISSDSAASLSSSSSSSSSSAPPTLNNALADLEETLREVTREVYNAPKRRVDNEVTRLTDSISLLQMHLTIVDDLVKQYRNATFKARVSIIMALVASSGLSVGSLLLPIIPMEVTVPVSVFSFGATAVLYYLQNQGMNDEIKRLVTDDAMVATYKRLYGRRSGLLTSQDKEHYMKDEHLSALWNRIHDHLMVALSTNDLKSMDKVKANDLKELEKILEYDIPQLRRKAAPAFNTKI